MSTKKRARLLSDSESENGETDAPPVWTSPTSRKMAELGDEEDSDDDLVIHRRRDTTTHNAEAEVSPVPGNNPNANHTEGGRRQTERSNSPEISRRTISDGVDRNQDENPDDDLEEIFADEEELNAAVDMNVGAEELLNAEQTDTAAAVKKKRVIRKRQTLNAKLMIDKDRGLLALNRSCRKIKFKGKGYEEQDLEALLWSVEHWAHSLCPQMKFADFLEQSERLGKKQEVKNFMRSVRSGELEYGLPDIDSDRENKKDDKKKQDLDFDDVLMEEEELIREMSTMQDESFANENEVNHRYNEISQNDPQGSQNNSMNTTNINSFHASRLITSTPYPKHLLTNNEAVNVEKSPLSDEIARKIEEKRQLALAKRAQRASMQPPHVPEATVSETS
ncbi:uncharacterized protein LOC142340938 [Convolutriloba macropyga]|uniref:uncharacterized protein LOC142340938 n=1 Tax=Convolutriloba macropyga TaxID=536237 RepID=UPI003F524C78